MKIAANIIGEELKEFETQFRQAVKVMFHCSIK